MARVIGDDALEVGKASERAVCVHRDVRRSGTLVAREAPPKHLVPADVGAFAGPDNDRRTHARVQHDRSDPLVALANAKVS